MDVARTPRNGFMRFDPSRPDLLVPVQWFFCQPGAKVYPGYHRFATANYDSEYTQTDLSLGMDPELPQQRVVPTAPTVATGQNFCGNPLRFTQGVDLVNGPQVVRDLDGIPACCYPGGIIPPDLILHGLILQEDGSYIRSEDNGYIPLES